MLLAHVTRHKLHHEIGTACVPYVRCGICVSHIFSTCDLFEYIVCSNSIYCAALLLELNSEKVQ